MYYPVRGRELCRCPPPSLGIAKATVRGRDTIPTSLRTPLILITEFSEELLTG